MVRLYSERQQMVEFTAAPPIGSGRQAVKYRQYSSLATHNE